MVLAETVLRLTAERERADEWGLVLASAGIASRTEMQGSRCAVITASEDAVRAEATLAAYERENPARPAVAAAPREYGLTYAGVVIGLLLLAFYAVTGPRDAGGVWFRRGSATAELIVRGEVWRTVTALTLHADLAHVAGNALFGALFATALCRAVGPGVGVWLMLLTGAAGNALNALLHGSRHSAVGASTAILGAVGSLGTLQFVRRSRLQVTRWRTWAPIAAALGLLAMVGMGSDTDFLAHGFGFLVGSVLGLAAGRALRHPPGGLAQATLEFLALGAVVACWYVALR